VVEALCAAHDIWLWHACRVEVERNQAHARTLVDDTTWDAAWTEGQGMTLEQAIAYALEATGPW
jgi:hypothetical protein